MRQVYNFSAGPGMLPEEVLKLAQKEMLDWHGVGMSIMEVGHRGPQFQSVADQAEADLRELMDIPSNYKVLFLAGGASVHFAMVPLNLLGKNKQADYIDTGIWSKKAIDEARRYGEINIAAEIYKGSSVYIPEQAEWNLNPRADYVHYTPNETIEGIEFNWVPDTKEIPLVADMSSMILSKAVDINQFGLIYAGAQKNIGQAGISIAIIREDLLKEPLPGTPTLYNYQVQVESESFYNTPPTYSWYIAGLVFAWMKQKGGVEYFSALNKRKSTKLYSTIDSYSDFYINRIRSDSRSRMNVSFDLKTPELVQLFLDSAEKKGLVNLKGHRLAGGIRASIYNAMPEEGVDKLIVFMKNFAEKYG